MEASSLMMMFAGMSAVSSSMSAVAQYQKGKAEQAAYDYNADVAMANAKDQAATSQAKYQRLMGRQRALYAKAGVDITSGSPLLILADTAMQAEQEQESLMRSATMSSELQRFYGKQARFAGTTGAMNTFLTGLGESALQARLIQKGINPKTYGTL